VCAGLKPRSTSDAHLNHERKPGYIRVAARWLSGSYNQLCMRRRIGLRWVVAALVLTIVAPLTVLGGIGIERSWRRQLANLNRQNLATVRAISVAIDQEVQGTTAALNVLGELHALDAPDLPAFESLAGRLLPYQPTWSAIILSDAEGRIVDGVPDRNDGGARVEDLTWARATVQRRTPSVSNIFELAGTTDHFVIIGVPVMRGGRLAFVLGARMRTDAFSSILRRQQAPPDGAVALVDASMHVIARTKDEESFVGKPALRSFIDASARSNEGSWQAVAPDGTTNYASFSRSSRTGLMVGMGIPTAEIDGPIRRLVMYLSLGWLVIIGSGAVLGLLLGGVIVRSLSGASKAALALSRDEPFDPRSSRIAEIDDLAAGLRSAAVTLHQRNIERDEAARLKDEFLMTVSHELRTPLTAIVGWARMLSTGQIREAQRVNAMGAIERNANALHQLVNDLLDVSRIVSGNLRLDVQPVLVEEVVSAAIDSVRPAAEAKEIAIVTEFGSDITVRGDAGRLQQVVWNLLSNAVKFTPEGGRISIGVERSGATAEITVADTGSGITPGFLPYVFDRFRQAESGTTRVHGGLGLGLAIVRHLVELHGGTASVENNVPPPGCTFRVRMPLRAGTAAASGSRATAAPVPVSRLDDLEVLVVDDDPQARELFATILDNAGAHVRAAASAEDALTLLATEWADVLVSDIEMPNEDGYALLRRARAMSDTGKTLVAVAVTAHARPDDQSRALDNGFAWHLSKPVEPEELVRVVAMVIEQGVELRG
jgi:signal transduction histidine kinase/CheY-like chemotaxis protein